jgi:hypothetical protein
MAALRHALVSVLAHDYDAPEQRPVAVAGVNRALAELAAAAEGAPPPPPDAAPSYDEEAIAHASPADKANAAAIFFASKAFFDVDEMQPWVLPHGRGIKENYTLAEKVGMFKRGEGARGQAAWRAAMKAAKATNN